MIIDHHLTVQAATISSSVKQLVLADGPERS